MNEENPFAPAGIALADPPRLGVWKHIAGAVMAFCGIAATTWASVLLIFFGDSSESWPGFIACFPAAILGALAFALVFESVKPLALALGLIFAGFLLALLLLSTVHPLDPTLTSMPSRSSGFITIHWIMLASSGLSLTFGFPCLATSQRCRTSQRLTALMIVVFSGGYTWCWLLGAVHVLA